MKQAIPHLDLPDDLEISSILTEDEKPKVRMKIIQIKLPKKEESGPAFHEKSAKNSKVNVRKNRKEIMQKKYGKPISRGGKK
jgi:ATP-dependent RNA helicase RhlE